MSDAHAGIEEFRTELFAAGVLLPTAVDGIYLRSSAFEAVVAGIDRLVSAAGRDQRAVAYHFPVIVPRSLLDETDYIRSFPDMSGVISGYTGGEARYGELLEAVDRSRDWSEVLTVTDLALCSAACHPLYGTLTGPIPAGGERYEVFGNCFRHEPSRDPARMQSFRQHEFVYVGDAEGAVAHRDLWVERALDLHSSLGLKVEAVVANDPFFGRGGKMLASNQVAEVLKIEIVSPICSVESPTAITSANCHRDHFGVAYSIESESGEPVHSACVGFGAERIALALFHTHGVELTDWAPGIRDRLGL